jgi:hypothetical protein
MRAIRLWGLAIAMSFGGCLCEPGQVDLRTSACITCRGFIRERLKAPSSAEFQPCYSAVIKQGTDGVWGVGFWVDAENSFGAKLRTAYACILEDTGDGNWRLQELEEIDR